MICPFAMNLAQRRKKPTVLEPLGMYPPRARKRAGKRLFNRILTSRMVRQARAVIAASNAEANALRALADPAKITVRRNGIDIEAFSKLPLADSLRKRWRIANHEKIVMFIGRLSPIKNLGPLIIAFGRSKIPNSRLVLVGPSESTYEQELRKIVQSEGLEGCVTFAGPFYDEDQKAALASADLFVLPSLNESFGNAAGEAVAAGVPVLLTNTCGIASLIDGRAGLAVPLGVEPLAEGIRVMMDPVVRRQMTEGREEVKRELSWNEPIRQTIELYERVVAESKK
jgi:glycosyltransferase involved in cell wall biosynthesis